MAAKQKNILQYFKATTTVKRASSVVTGSSVDSSEVDGAKKLQQAAKKPKLMECKATNGTITGFIELNNTDIKEEISQFAAKFPALHTNILPAWFRALRPEFKKPYFQKLSSFLVAERQKNQVYPPEEHVWSWTLLPLESVKVVILGQDPYHGKGQAHGLCFSVRTGVPPPPSLVNMYKELKSDISGFTHPGHGNLTGWCKQGVLLLNATLTVRANDAKSHANQGWETFTDAVIQLVSARCNGVVFLLWGSHAQSKIVLIDKKKHHILKSSHPSPLSVYRGFEGCKHFSLCNAKLKEQGKEEIDWNHLPA